ncbi:MAG: protein tyrosine phosphatase family protein [Pseudomonadota bacterium]
MSILTVLSDSIRSNVRRVFAVLLCLSSAVAAADDIVNYHAYTPLFASAGQPTEAQFLMLRDGGFETVVYVAYTDHENSLPNADRLAHQQGLTYVHIPVDWNNPTLQDFQLIANVLEQNRQRKTLLHCQLNYRASVFAMLYRVLYQDVPVLDAKRDMNAVWQPNQTWTDFMRDVLSAGGIDPDCEGCDWSVEAG